MINDETIYWQCGFSAGNASRRHDAGLVRHQRDWFRRAIALEKTAEDKAIADKAFNRGYSEAAKRY